MVALKPSYHLLDTPRKNHLIGSIQTLGKVRPAARQHGIPESTARNIWNKFKKTGTVSNRPRTGRPRVTTAHEDRIIQREALKTRRAPFREIGNRITNRISERTVQR